MGLFAWAESLVKKMTVWDISLLKTSVLILVMIIGAYISTFVKEYVVYFIVVFAVMYLVLLYRVFRSS